MFCKNCGNKLYQDAKFCEYCGTLINHIEPKVDPQDVSVTNSFPSPQSNRLENVRTHNRSVQKKKKRQQQRIIGIVALMLVITIGLLFSCIIGIGPINTSSNIFHQINYNNGAQFAYDNNRLYIIGLYNTDDKETSLYSIDYNGVNKKMISNDSNINSIRLVNGRIYYKSNCDNKYSIGVMNTDGSGNTTIITSGESLGRYDIYKNKLYYMQNSDIHTCSITGENDETIIASIKTFTLCNGFIYYINKDDVISSYCIKNYKTKELCKIPGAKSLSINKDTLYVVDDNGLSSIHIKGSENNTRIVQDDSLSNYVFYNNQIYYNHQMTENDIKELAEYLSDSYSDSIVYMIGLFGVGRLYRSNFNKGIGEYVDSDQPFIYSLYTYPKGLYCQVSLWSNQIVPIQLD